MFTYQKTPEAVARLSPEQYRLTQESGIEVPEAASFSTTASSEST